MVPEYPYGPSQIYKQSNFGLYGRQKIRFGNMVSEKNEIKTRRYWRPNVQFKRLWSQSLQKFIKLRVTTRVLRTVDKVGGLDAYLLGDKAARIKELGMGGWKLRWRVMQTPMVRKIFSKERERLGLPPQEEYISSTGDKTSKEGVQAEIQKFDEDLWNGGSVDLAEDVPGVAVEVEEELKEKKFMHEEPGPKGKVLI